MGETRPQVEGEALGSSLDSVIEVYKQDVDRTLLREQLRKTPDERVRELAEMERFAEALRDATTKTPSG